MSLFELKQLIDKAVEKAAGVDREVELWQETEDGSVQYEIVKISQFGIVPDVNIRIQKMD